MKFKQPIDGNYYNSRFSCDFIDELTKVIRSTASDELDYSIKLVPEVNLEKFQFSRIYFRSPINRQITSDSATSLFNFLSWRRSARAGIDFEYPLSPPLPPRLIRLPVRGTNFQYEKNAGGAQNVGQVRKKPCGG